MNKEGGKVTEIQSRMTRMRKEDKKHEDNPEEEILNSRERRANSKE